MVPVHPNIFREREIEYKKGLRQSEIKCLNFKPAQNHFSEKKLSSTTHNPIAFIEKN